MNSINKTIQVLHMRDIFGAYLAALLIGYIVLDKGFGYLGIGKLYISEIGIALGSLTLFILWVKRELFWQRLKQPAVILLLVFMSWGLVRTLPYLRPYGLTALRDAVLWGYGIFALLVCLIFPRNYLEYFIKLYNRLLPFILYWLPIAFILYWYAGVRLSLFGAPVPILALKSGDTGVHLGAIAAFLLLRMDKTDRPYSNWTRTGLWVLWWVACVMYGVISRAGLFSALIGIAAVLFVQPRSDWLRPLISGTLVMGFLFVSGLSIRVPDVTRNVSISFDQVKINFLSLSAVRTDESGIQPPATPATQPPATPATQPLATPATQPPATPATQPSATASIQNENLRISTITYRMDWWKKIFNYTFNGSYFWTGKGYGINLADEDGFQVLPEHALRSPHNATMTILARSGVPGLVLWLAFLGMVAFQAARMIYSRHIRLDHSLISWTTIYIFILLFNSSFDVFLEGPMGGIWFWSLSGALFILSASANHGE